MKNESRDIALEQQIDAYINGKLSREEVDKLWVELLKKPEYIPLLQTEIDLTRFYEAHQQEQKATLYYWKWVAAAAAVVLLVVSINLWGGHSTKSIQQWAAGSINLAENLATAPVRRSSVEMNPSDSMLNAGYKAAVSGKEARAMRIYKQILTRYDDPHIIAKANLNLGMLLYNAGDYTKSIRDFKEAIAYAQQQEVVIENAYWYMGNAYIKVKDYKSARNAVQQAYSHGRIHKSESSELLKRLDDKLSNADSSNFKPLKDE